MQRTIIETAELSGLPLAEIKSWLGISQPGDDAMLISLLATSLASCESFIGRAPLLQTVEERVPASPGRIRIGERPVQSLISVEFVAEDGTRSPAEASDFSLEIDAEGVATLLLHRQEAAPTIAVRVAAGMADEWAKMPAQLKQGIIRLTAHLFRDRDRSASSAARATPPASVLALWRPWRDVRLK